VKDFKITAKINLLSSKTFEGTRVTLQWLNHPKGPVVASNLRVIVESVPTSGNRSVYLYLSYTQNSQSKTISERSATEIGSMDSKGKFSLNPKWKMKLEYYKKGAFVLDPFNSSFEKFILTFSE
jgi:hypothetical protein